MKLLSSALALAVLVGQAPNVGAAPEANARTKKAAARLLDEGNRLFEKHQFEDALARYQRAYDAFPSPMILFNLGEAKRELDQPAAAANDYAAFLRSGRAAAGSEIESQARKQLHALEKKTARLHLSAVGDGSEVSVDGQRLEAQAREELYVLPGPHQLVASAGARKVPCERGLTIAAGDAAEVAFDCAAPTSAIAVVKAPPPPPKAELATPPVSDGNPRTDVLPPPALSASTGGPEAEGSSIFKTWWFWTITGVVVAAGAGVGIAVLGRPDASPAELGVSSTKDWRSL